MNGQAPNTNWHANGNANHNSNPNANPSASSSSIDIHIDVQIALNGITLPSVLVPHVQVQSSWQATTQVNTSTTAAPTTMSTDDNAAVVEEIDVDEPADEPADEYPDAHMSDASGSTVTLELEEDVELPDTEEDSNTMAHEFADVELPKLERLAGPVQWGYTDAEHPNLDTSNTVLFEYVDAELPNLEDTANRVTLGNIDAELPDLEDPSNTVLFEYVDVDIPAVDQPSSPATLEHADAEVPAMDRPSGGVWRRFTVAQILAMEEASEQSIFYTPPVNNPSHNVYAGTVSDITEPMPYVERLRYACWLLDQIIIWTPIVAKQSKLVDSMPVEQRPRQIPRIPIESNFSRRERIAADFSLDREIAFLTREHHRLHMLAHPGQEYVPVEIDEDRNAVSDIRPFAAIMADMALDEEDDEQAREMAEDLREFEEFLAADDTEVEDGAGAEHTQEYESQEYDEEFPDIYNA